MLLGDRVLLKRNCRNGIRDPLMEKLSNALLALQPQ